MEQYSIHLEDDATPHHGHAYKVPQAYKLTLQKEVDRLVKIGVLKKVNHSQWAAPTFLIPKPDKTIRFIGDFREVNKRIKRYPFPMPDVKDLVLKLEDFHWTTALHLNMVFTT